MAENNSASSPDGNVQSMREALYAQKQLLQQMSTELDEEREAAASAASEALSMILRLQGEKATLKMEASQYKRIAEEKMCHAEEALAVFEDLIYQREMEIASLEFQVQAYRYRLISMGCNDLGVYETKYPDNMLIQRNGGSSGSLRRLGSLPQVLNLTKDSGKRSSIESRRSATPPKLDSAAAGSADDSSSCKDTDSYWEQIKKMDERVKEISESRESVRNKCSILKGSTWSPSMFEQAGTGQQGDPGKESDVACSDQMQNCESPPCVNAAADSAVLQDIYEVSPVEETKKSIRLAQDGKQGLEKAKLRQKNESSRIRKPPHSTITELRIPKPRYGISVERSPSIGLQGLTTVDSHSGYHQLVSRLERLEKERTSSRQEITNDGNEELYLLKEIHEEIKTIHSEIRKWRAENSRPRRDPPLDPLQEAMLYFWL